MLSPSDWLSRLLDLVPVRGQVELRCHYGAPWRIDQAAAGAAEIPYHVVLEGSAVLEDPAGGPPTRLAAGDILILTNGGAHVLHDGGGKRAKPAQDRKGVHVVISENAGTGDRLDMMCGRFMLTAAHDRLLRHYLPPRLVVRAASGAPGEDRGATTGQLAGLIALMRLESSGEGLGGRAMLNALSLALFTLALRRASEIAAAPTGLLTIARNPRLAPALSAMFHRPAHPWSLPEIARLCNMSRATLVRHFQEQLGRSASDLLTDIRMTLAANELGSTADSTAMIGEKVGYQSEAAFQRAFKQHMGVTPAQWRRAARSGAEGPR